MFRGLSIRITAIHEYLILFQINGLIDSGLLMDFKHDFKSFATPNGFHRSINRKSGNTPILMQQGTMFDQQSFSFLFFVLIFTNSINSDGHLATQPTKVRSIWVAFTLTVPNTCFFLDFLLMLLYRIYSKYFKYFKCFTNPLQNRVF